MLTQWAWLRDALAPGGVTLRVYIVADDDNLDLAQQYGFSTVECPNDRMGTKWNEGFTRAARDGADWFVLVGSDNWVHPDTFAALEDDCINAASALDFVDLPRGVLQHARFANLIPWVIPRSLFADNFAPLPPAMQRGSEGMLMHALDHPEFVQRRAPSVNFNTTDSVSPYVGVANSIGDGIEHEAWPALAAHYPAHLVEAARLLSEETA